MAPEVTSESSMGKKATPGTLVLAAAAGRGVVPIAAHERCVLDVCSAPSTNTPALQEFNHSLRTASVPWLF
jgi:hypothetical protein